MDRIFECMWWTLWIYVGILSLVCIICVFRYMSSSLEVRQGGSVIYWIMILTYKYRFVVLLCIRSFVTYLWLCDMNVRSWMKVSIYMDKYICDNVFGYEVSTWVHGWSCEMVYDGKCDTGRDESVLVDTELLLGLWCICEILVDT